MTTKYCLKCGKPVEMCDECKGGRRLIIVGNNIGCPKCNGTGVVHKCKPEDLEEKSFEERWPEDEKEREDGS